MLRRALAGVTASSTIGLGLGSARGDELVAMLGARSDAFAAGSRRRAAQRHEAMWGLREDRRCSTAATKPMS